MERGHRPPGFWPAEAIPASHPMYDIGRSCGFRRTLGREVREFHVTLNGRHF